MNKFLTILLMLVSLNQSWSQTELTKDIAEELSTKDLSLSELTNYVKKTFPDNLAKAKFFYHWISFSIKYDLEVKNRHSKGIYTEQDYIHNTDPLKVFERRKAVCEGYSQLFKWFMKELRIETFIVRGHIRHITNPYVEPELDQNFSHAWNVSKINGEWLIIDTTWAQQFETNVPDFYFNINPENAIITHYPSENKWQLLERPLSLEEFNNSQYIDPLYFLTGFTEKPSLKQDEKFYYFVYKNNPNRNWLVRLGFGTDNINYEPVPGIDILEQDGYTYYRFDKKHIPKKAAFKVDLNNFNEEEQTFALYENIILFKI